MPHSLTLNSVCDKTVPLFCGADLQVSFSFIQSILQILTDHDSIVGPFRKHGAKEKPASKMATFSRVDAYNGTTTERPVISKFDENVHVISHVLSASCRK